MKKVLILISCIILASVCLANGMDYRPIEAKEKEKKPEVWCPVTKFSDNDKCMICHKMVRGLDGKAKFSLKEISPGEHYDLGYNDCLSVIEDKDGVRRPRYELTVIDATEFRRSLEFIELHPELGTEVTVDIFSPGGNLMVAWKIISIMNEYREKGFEFHTRVEGFAASAGFLIFCAGNISTRTVNPHSQLMWHELWQITFLQLDTPSSKEDEAEILRSFQNNIHDWLITRCTKKITKEHLDKAVHKKDYWLTGKEMVELGFADGFIGKQ